MTERRNWRIFVIQTWQEEDLNYFIERAKSSGLARITIFSVGRGFKYCKELWKECQMATNDNFHVNLLTNWALARSMLRRPEWRASSSAVWAWSRNSIAWVMPADPWFTELDWRSCASARVARMKAGCILTRSLSLKSCRARISIFTKESWWIALRRLQKCVKWRRRKLWCSQKIHMLHDFWGTYSNNVGEGRHKEAGTVSLPINPGNSVPPVSLPRFQVR